MRPCLFNLFFFLTPSPPAPEVDRLRVYDGLIMFCCFVPASQSLAHTFAGDLESV